ncbi:amidohydrolase family protein, partial [Sulfobacillus harzensis]|nr:amidohydrolase family protein [Sulfobacillus harzensis]
MRLTLTHGRIYQDRTQNQWIVEPNGAVIIDNGRITAVGPTSQLLSQERNLGTVVDVEGRAVVPGFIDCHTHLPFAGWRDDEYVARLQGVSYESLSQRKGGIARSSDQWATASDTEILTLTTQLATEALAWGTTVLEMKTGYGLTLDEEMRALRLIQQLMDQLPQDIIATGLFLHAHPRTGSKSDWLNTVRSQLLPQAAAMGFLSAVDAFVERTAYSPAEVASVFESLPANLTVRLHTNQFSQIGGIELGVRLGARSVEHLECLSLDEIDLMATHHMAAVIMPGAAFYGGAGGYAPVRKILDRGVHLALATDFNPGSSPIGNLPTVVALAVNLLAACVNSPEHPAQKGLRDPDGEIKT